MRGVVDLMNELSDNEYDNYYEYENPIEAQYIEPQQIQVQNPLKYNTIQYYSGKPKYILKDDLISNGVFLRNDNLKYIIKEDLVKILCMILFDNVVIIPTHQKQKMNLLNYVSNKYQIPFKRLGRRSLAKTDQLLSSIIPRSFNIVTEDEIGNRYNLQKNSR